MGRAGQLSLLVGSCVALTLRCYPTSEIDARPPGMSEAGASTDTEVATFAIDRISLGDADDAGFNASAWRGLGYDLDGKITAIYSSDTCALLAGAPVNNQVDGLAGIDNSFGSLIVPLVGQMSQPLCFLNCPDAGPRNLTADETQAIDRGEFTLQIQTIGLSSDPAQTATGLRAAVFASDAFDPTGASTPAFDESTTWPVLAESLVDPSSIATGARAQFASAYVTRGTFVAGVNELVTVPLHVVLDGLKFTLMIHGAIITFDHADRDDAVNGVLAGVLDLSEFTDMFHRVMTRITSSLCGGAFDGIAGLLAQAAEMFVDRTNGPNGPCTGISIGIGFHAKRIANPTTITPALAGTPDPCGPASDAGEDAAADSPTD